jgi:hypothetical protein
MDTDEKRKILLFRPAQLYELRSRDSSEDVHYVGLGWSVLEFLSWKSFACHKYLRLLIPTSGIKKSPSSSNMPSIWRIWVPAETLECERSASICLEWTWYLITRKKLDRNNILAQWSKEVILCLKLSLMLRDHQGVNLIATSSLNSYWIIFSIQITNFLNTLDSSSVRTPIQGITYILLWRHSILKPLKSSAAE